MMSGAFSFWHWVVVLAVVMVVFGTKRLRNIGGDLGEAIKGFKQAMREGEEPSQPQGEAAAARLDHDHRG